MAILRYVKIMLCVTTVSGEPSTEISAHTFLSVYQRKTFVHITALQIRENVDHIGYIYG